MSARDTSDDPRRAALREFRYRHEAEVVRGLLRADGIEAFVVSDDSGAQSPALTFSRGAILLVDIHDLDAAERVLAESEGEAPKESNQ